VARSTGSPNLEYETELRDASGANRNEAAAVDALAGGGVTSHFEWVAVAEREHVAMTASDGKDRRDGLAKRAEKFFERAKSQASAVQIAAFAWLLGLFGVWAGGIQPLGRRYLEKTQRQASARIELEQKRRELRTISESQKPSQAVAMAVTPAEASGASVKENPVPRSKAGLEAYSRSRELQGDIVDLRKELDELQVGFKVPGVDLKMPLVVAPLVWIFLMLGLIYTLARTRRRVLSLTAQGTRILREELSTPPSEISDVAGDFPFWLAPLPIHRAPTDEKALALRSVLGWENKSFTNSVKVLAFLAILLLWQAQVCWLNVDLGKAIIEKTATPAPMIGARSNAVSKHAGKRLASVSTDAVAPTPQSKRIDLDLSVGSWRQDSRLALLELDILTIAVLALSAWGVLSWWPPKTVSDRYACEPTGSQQRLSDLWLHLRLRRHAVRTETGGKTTAESALQVARTFFSRRRLLAGSIGAVAAGLAVVALTRRGHFAESGGLPTKLHVRPRHLSRRKQRSVKTELGSGFHRNARTDIIHWVGTKGEIRGVGRINAAALRGVGESQPVQLEGKRELPRVHLSASSHSFEEAARQQQRLGRFREACDLLLLGIRHDERLRAVAPADVKTPVLRQRTRTKSNATGETAGTPIGTITPRRPSLRLYDLLARIAREQDLPKYLEEAVNTVRAAQPAYRADHVFHAKIEQRISKWSDPSSDWRRGRKAATNE
jgi:hypothetical protein